MAAITCQALSKRYGTVTAVDALDLAIAEGEFMVLLGPSGCGKTTTLRCVAGLERPDAGVIAVGDRVLFDSSKGVAVPLNERGIGMVFQSYAIWPHMTVFENIAFPLRVAKGQRPGREEVRSLVEQALSTVGLSGYGDRPATRLSGGQQQRVALARAIVHRPKLLLLDEPLSNLDAALREEMRVELRRLQQQIGVTTIYVTHDQSEALAMSDRIAVMEKGRIVQMGDPREIYFRPANMFVASFIGAANLLRGVCESAVAAGAEGTVRLADGSRIGSLFPAGGATGQETTVSVRPESILLVGSDAGVLRGTVSAASFLGGSARYDVAVGDLVIRVVGSAEQVVEPGTVVGLSFPASSAVAVG